MSRQNKPTQNKQTQNNETLLGFYFGDVTEERRLLIEKELLTDPEFLLDYLDFKRQIEKAAPVPAYPSPSLWRKLNALPKRRRNIFLAFSAAAVAALFVLFFVSRFSEKDRRAELSGGILFDTRGEHSSVSDVL